MSERSDLPLRDAERQMLQRYGFDSTTFFRLQQALAESRMSPAANRLETPVAPPAAGDLLTWPEDGSERAHRWDTLGEVALQQEQVGVVVLNGGMATRFGGVVKGIVPVVDDASFLALRLRDIARAPGAVTTFLMNSFATDAVTREHLEAHGYFGLDPARTHMLTQHISLRLRPSGELYRDREGAVSFYAPGHGDLFDVIARSDAFTGFVAGGGKYLVVGNVDNLGATLSPRVLGAHIDARRAVTVEVAERSKGDKGGAPARVDGRVVIVEGFRFPADFDIATIPVFNTNTLVVSVEAMRADYPLTWFRADKKVNDEPVVQFERLMGEVTSFVDSTYLTVPREGEAGRFLPVKTPADLEARRPTIRRRFASLL